MKKLFALLILCLIAQYCVAQHEADIWYFGYNVGLTFNGGAPVPLTNGQINTLEGCASIADATTGQLLMYTDGIKVWDKNHNPMPGCLTTPLLGDPSSTMSGVIVPKPGNPNLYYIFTTPAQLDLYSPPGALPYMRYSIVDLSLNNGNGDITTFNIPIMDSAAEKIAVTANCSRTAYWVVGHRWNCDSFYAFKLTDVGLEEPVKSAVGLVHIDTPISNGAALGYMKFSPNGKKLGLAISGRVNAVEIFDFNTLTGKISNPITDLYPITPNSSFTFPGVYGCSFSPDNSKFYAATTEGYLDSTFIFQYNMEAGSSAAILASKIKVVSKFFTNFGALQNAPDGKMYVSIPFPSGLDVINNPNALGTACNYSSTNLNLMPGQVAYGLPCMVESFLSGSTPIPSFVVPSKLTVCMGDTLWSEQASVGRFSIEPSDSVWIDVDHSRIGFFPSVATTYTVTQTGDCDWGDTVKFTIKVAKGPTADFVFNPANPTSNNNTIQLKNMSVNARSYEWRDNVWSILSQDVDYTLPNPGNGVFCYKLIAIDSLQCKDTTEKCVTIVPVIPSKVFMPNAFTPNGDGLNDEFKINAINITLESFVVYNRYGQKVFYTNNIDKGWDGHFNGKLCDLGTYFYQIKYTDHKGEKKTLKNDVELVR